MAPTLKLIKNPYWLVGIILTLLAVALFVHLGDIGLRAEEPRRAIVGIETLMSGNLVVPQIHEWTYYNKPPFFNWVLAGTFILTGSFAEWSVRLPGVISLILVATGIYYLGRKYLDKQTALYSALFFITSSELLFYALVNAGEIDLFYTLITFLQVIPLLLFKDKKRLLLMFLLSYLFAAVGTLTKGLPSVAFQGITIIAILGSDNRWKRLFSWQHFVGIGVFSALVGGYFYLYAQQDDLNGFLANLYKESSQRSANEHGFSSILSHLFIFPFEFFGLLIPWAFLLLFMLKKGVRAAILANPLLKFSTIFILANIGLYWISPGIRGRYLYMFLPFVVILLTYFYVKHKDQMPRTNRFLEMVFGFLIAAMVLFFISFPWIEAINQEVSRPMLIGVVFACLLGLVFVLYMKLPEKRILLLVLALVIGRIGHNVALLPHLHAHSRCSLYMANVDSILEKANGERVMLSGRSIQWAPDVNLFGTKLGEEKLTIPPPLPYQIPYYYFMGSGELLSYTPDPQVGKMYIAHTRYVQRVDKKILYTFMDEWTREEMILFIVE